MKQTLLILTLLCAYLFSTNILMAQCPNTGIAPVAVCQNLTVVLNASGNGTLTTNDIDGGSTDDCGIVSMTASQTTFTCADIGAGAAANDLVITAAYDGPLTGGTPKGAELYVINNIPDLSLYGIGFANNGGGTDGEEFTFPAVSVTAGTYLYITTDSAKFNDWFGFDADYITGFASINGDDAIELFFNSAVIDVFGDINVDGTGQPWEYMDSWAYRNNTTGPDGTTFILGNWSFSGINALDGETSNGTATTPVPVGTYVPATGGIAVTLVVVDGEGNFDNCVATVTVVDNMAPTITCPSNQTGILDASCQFTLLDYTGLATVGDNCAASPTITQSPIAGTVISANTTITLTATDGSGNISQCNFMVQASDTTSPLLNCNDTTVYIGFTGGIIDPILIVTPIDCSPPFTYNFSTGNSVSCADVGLTLTKMLTVTDVFGNSSTCTSLVTVLDTISPTITCPANINACQGDVVTFSTPPATDNCLATVTQTDATGLSSGMIFPNGTTTLQFTATDGSGNTAICTFDVTVNSVDTSVTTSGVNSISANATGATYQWLDCNNGNAIITGATNQTYAINFSGNYAVEVTQNGCVDTSSCYLVISVGIEELGASNNWVLYPNPTSRNVTLDLNKTLVNIQISIIDITGKEIYSINNVKINKLEINTQHFSKGVFFVKIQSENQQKVIKLIRK